MIHLHTVAEYQQAIGQYQAEIERDQKIIKKLRIEIQAHKEATAIIFGAILAGKFDDLTRMAKKAQKEALST